MALWRRASVHASYAEGPEFESWSLHAFFSSFFLAPKHDFSHDMKL